MAYFLRFTLLLSSVLLVSASEPKRWTIDAMMAIQTIHDPQLSSDGSKAAFVVRRVDDAHNRYTAAIWISEAAGKSMPLRAGHRTDSSPRWSPDGSSLAFVSRRDGSAQIYMIGNVADTPRQLTKSTTGIESFAWSPDGKSIAYIAPEPVRAEAQKKRSAGDDAIVAGEGYRNSGITIISTKDGNTRAVPSPLHIVSFDWSPDGQKMVVAAQKTSRGRDRFHSDIFVIDLDGGHHTPLVEQPGQDLSPAYSRDGKYVAFYSQRGSLSYFGERQVGVVPAAGGRISYITQSLDADVFNGARKVWWSPGNNELWFGAGKGTGSYLYAVNVQSGKSKQLPYRLTDPAAFSVSADGSQVLWLRASSNAPAELYRDQKLLYSANPQLTELHAVKAETVRWKSRDGLHVEGVLRMPFKRSPGKPVPLLTIIHGGPTGASTEDFPVARMFPTQLFLEEGFAVFEPNFRGSIHYGPKFRTPLAQQLGMGDMDDVMTGIDMLIAKGVADPDRLGLMGWSYGGYLTSWIVGHTDRFKAASMGGCSMDWITYYGMSVGGLDGPPEVMQEYFGGTAWSRLDAYDRHSPRPSLKNVKTPSLLLRGEIDQDTMAEMYIALEELNVPVEFVTYPREPHSIGEPMHQRDLMRRNVEWFRRWVIAPK